MLSILCILLGVVPIDIAPRALCTYGVFYIIQICKKKIPCQTMIKKLVLLSSLSFLNAEKSIKKQPRKYKRFLLFYARVRYLTRRVGHQAADKLIKCLGSVAKQ